MLPCSQDFIDAMLSPVKTFYVKLELYDSEDVFIDEITHEVLSEDLGSISVDLESPIQRNFSFSLDNSDNKFDWGEQNLIWIDKRCKLYTGLRTRKGVEYILQGIFILTEPTQTHGEGGKTITLTGQDKMYYYTDMRGKMINELTIEDKTPITSAIKLVAKGETKFNFDDIDDKVPYELTYQADDNRYTIMEELADFAQCRIYYDVNGYLRLKKMDLNELQNYPPVWRYSSEGYSDKLFSGSTRSMDDSKMANHIRVYGETIVKEGDPEDKKPETIMYDLVVDEEDELWTASPYSIQKIGVVYYGHNSGNVDALIITEEEAKARAKWELMHRLGYGETVELPIAVNYLHEAGDIIEIEDEENGVKKARYLLQSFSVPITPSQMSLSCRKERKLIEDWDFI